MPEEREETRHEHTEQFRTAYNILIDPAASTTASWESETARRARERREHEEQYAQRVRGWLENPCDCGNCAYARTLHEIRFEGEPESHTPTLLTTHDTDFAIPPPNYSYIDSDSEWSSFKLHCDYIINGMLEMHDASLCGQCRAANQVRPDRDHLEIARGLQRARARREFDAARSRRREVLLNPCPQQGFFNEDEEPPYCENCNGEGCYDCPSEGSALHSYSYVPRFKYFGDPNEPFFGVEVEVENPDSYISSRIDIAEEIDNDYGRWYVKEDGSLTAGFEIVSHPTTLREWRKREDTARLFEFLRNQGYRSFNTTTCGMHVHVGRTAMSPMTVAKMHVLFGAKPEWVLAVSRRRRSYLDQWARVEPSGKEPINTDYESLANPRKWCYQKAIRHNSGERYTAINCTNEDTVEFRFFRGTLHHEAFMRNLTLLDAMLHFTREKSMEEMNPVRFMEFCDSSLGRRLIGAEARELTGWLHSLPREEEASVEC